MDEQTRGFLEKMMDDLLKGEEKIVAEVQWVQHEIPITSIADLSLGYAVGVLTAVGVVTAGVKTNISKGITKPEMSGIRSTIQRMIKRRLPEILEKINSEMNI